MFGANGEAVHKQLVRAAIVFYEMARQLKAFCHLPKYEVGVFWVAMTSGCSGARLLAIKKNRQFRCMRQLVGFGMFIFSPLGGLSISVDTVSLGALFTLA